MLLAATAGAAGWWRRVLPGLLAFGGAIGSGSVARDPFDEVLVGVCEVAIAGCAAWLWLTTAVVAVDAVRGRPLAVAASPTPCAGWSSRPVASHWRVGSEHPPTPDTTANRHACRVCPCPTGRPRQPS